MLHFVTAGLRRDSGRPYNPARFGYEAHSARGTIRMSHRLSFASTRWAAPWLALAALAATARADIIIQTTPAPARSVSTSASIDADSDADGDSTSAGGAYNSLKSSSVSNATGTAVIGASQDSVIPNLTGTFMDGLGNLDATLLLVNPGIGTFEASSFFDVFFEVDVAQLYVVTASVDFASGSGVTGRTAATLVDETNASTLVDLLRDDGNPGFDVFAQQILLNPGVTYRLTGEVMVMGKLTAPGSTKGNGTWLLSIQAVPVPEPSALVLALTGAALAVLAARRTLFGGRMTHDR